MIIMATTKQVVDMKSKMIIIALAVSLSLLLIMESTLGVVSPPTSLTQVASSRRDLSTLANQNVNAQAGNVTQLSITALSVTKTWQGYYGNISGAIVLQNSNNKTFYNWTMASASGKIFASRASNAVFTAVNCTNSTQRGTEETALGVVTGDADSVASTFSGNTHPAFSVGTQSITANQCNATNAFGSTGPQAANFFQVLLSDSSSNTIYTTILNGSRAGFDGSNWDFELLVGQNGHAGGSTVTPYYFFVELN
jgi:hypothetical protein